MFFLNWLQRLLGLGEGETDGDTRGEADPDGLIGG